jgi:membrane-associated phospholipid phosphatase
MLFTVVLICLAKYWRRFNLLFACAGLAVVSGDLISYRVVKRFFERPRPGSFISGCTEPSCWGFVSSHSTNIAALSTILCLYDRRNVFWCLPIWFLVGGSRIVLGDHFALDVLFGGFLGVVIGFIIWYFLLALLPRLQLKNLFGKRT